MKYFWWFCGSQKCFSVKCVGKTLAYFTTFGTWVAIWVGFIQGVDWDMFINMLWTLEKLRKTFFCCKMTNFTLTELKFSGNIYFSYPERLVSAKVEKVLSLQRNHKKVTLLLIYHILAFKKSILKNYKNR